MPPVHHPFRITGKQREKRGGFDAKGYYIDYDALERLDTKGAYCCWLILQPGRTYMEPRRVRRLAEICRRKNLLVVSDEIHADMALNGATHTPFATVSDDALHNSITFCAPSKTFNIPGIVSSFSVVPDDEIRNRFYGWLQASELEAAPMMSYIATIAAYRHGKEWRREMLEYVVENMRTVADFCERNLPGIHAQIPEASFLMWLDCRGLGLDHDSLVDLFVNKARVALNDGAMFGEEGTGFMRLNVAAPRSVILQILDRIKDAVCGNNDSL